MIMFGEYVILVCLVVGACGMSTNVTIDGLGSVIGLQETTQWTNRTIYTFRGIPYAEPPVGDLRFRPPVKVTTWNGDLNATQFGNICPQSPHAATVLGLSGFNEDCLTLNVYVPEMDIEHKALPVMIFLHGGSFMAGFAQISEPHHLLEEDVILVVPQFRLGPLGLLCLQTDEIPGNVQFLDQIMAMKWVQDNIRHFGGDPDKVTLFGQSSGAASVMLHQFSPLSKGLFHRAIAQSGSPFAEWAMDYDPVPSAMRIGSLVGCNMTDTDSLAACLKGVDVQTLLYSFYNFFEINSGKGETASWGNKAVIQTAGTQRFLEEDPAALLARGEYSQMPMIGGVTKHEGSQVLAGEKDRTGTLSQTLMKTHFEEEDFGNFTKMSAGLIDICGLLPIKSGVFRMLQANSRVNTSYLYRFGYLGTKSTWYVDFDWNFGKGVPHGDDLPYLFPIFTDLSEKDIIVAKRFVKLWTSFAATGKPVADGKIWEPMSTPFGPYLIIDEELRDGTNFFNEYTVAAREGFAPVEKSLGFALAPQSIIFLTATLWFIFL